MFFKNEKKNKKFKAIFIISFLLTFLLIFIEAVMHFNMGAHTKKEMHKFDVFGKKIEVPNYMDLIQLGVIVFIFSIFNSYVTTHYIDKI